MDFDTFLKTQRWLIPKNIAVNELLFKGICSFAQKQSLFKEIGLIHIQNESKFPIEIHSHKYNQKPHLVLKLYSSFFYLDSTLVSEQFLKTTQDNRPPTLALGLEFIDLLIYPDAKEFETYKAGAMYLTTSLDKIREWIRSDISYSQSSIQDEKDCFDTNETTFLKLIDSIDQMYEDIQNLSTSSIERFANDFITFQNNKVGDFSINLQQDMLHALDNFTPDEVGKIEEKVFGH
jgi:hypothetical protein